MAHLSIRKFHRLVVEFSSHDVHIRSDGSASEESRECSGRKKKRERERERERGGRRKRERNRERENQVTLTINQVTVTNGRNSVLQVYSRVTHHFQ